MIEDESLPAVPLICWLLFMLVSPDALPPKVLSNTPPPNENMNHKRATMTAKILQLYLGLCIIARTVRKKKDMSDEETYKWKGEQAHFEGGSCCNTGHV